MFILFRIPRLRIHLYWTLHQESYLRHIVPSQQTQPRLQVVVLSTLVRQLNDFVPAFQYYVQHSILQPFQQLRHLLSHL